MRETSFRTTALRSGGDDDRCRAARRIRRDAAISVRCKPLRAASLISHPKWKGALIGTPNGEAEHIQAQRTTLVNGATGFVGGAVLRALRDSGEEPVSLVPHAPVADVADIATAKPVPSAAPVNGNFRRLEFRDECTLQPAMRGLKWLFLMRPPALGDVERWVFPLLDEAVKAGVERIVLLSVVGAETRAYLPHAKVAKVEARLAPLAQRTALAVGILRPGFFVQNLLSA